MSLPFDLVVFDMSGTTVKDQNEVMESFLEAATHYDLNTDPTHLNTMMGWSKIEVFRKLWTEKLGEGHPEIEIRAQKALQVFKKHLRAWYDTNPAQPNPGVEEVFDWLKKNKVKIALTTGFYREVTNQILQQLGWDIGLDSNHMGNEASIISVSISSDEVEHGRPEPDMLLKAMRMLGVKDPKRVIKVGDTPADLIAGHKAGVLLNIGITSGTHTEAELSAYPNDGFVFTLSQLKSFVAQKLSLESVEF
ncbi:MAG: HAD hydrolase-like protein [Saprospiraceae bacterium]|nr:HAD hydrolase-like protein [Saprospiraceae bacterium]